MSKLQNFFRKLFHECIWTNQEVEDTKDIMIKPSYWGMRAGYNTIDNYNKQMELYNGKSGVDICAVCGKERTFKN